MSCKCCCTHGHTAIQEKRNSLLKDYWRIILSALLLFGGLILNATDTTFFKGEYVPFIWYLLAYLPVGLPVMREAWESILQKDVFSEFTLMSIATLGAFYIGEYPEGVAVMLFYSLGELFQDKAVDKAKRNISALLDVRPETATVIRNGSTLVEAPQRVQVGETIEVKAGERVPLDGTMLDEVAAFNTSALTGESLPVKKDAEFVCQKSTSVAERANMLYSGCFVSAGNGQMLVTGVGNDTEFGQIAQELSSIEKTTTPLQEKLDKLGKQITVLGASAAAIVDVGIAMGIAGTDVTKEASDMVLLDDSFSTIIKAVQWGRGIYENFKRFIQFQLTVNVSSVVVVICSILAGFSAPFTALELLWINIIMDGPPALTLGLEPIRPDLLKHKPTRRNENIISKKTRRKKRRSKTISRNQCRNQKRNRI